jgi:hypothetical protein
MRAFLAIAFLALAVVAVAAEPPRAALYPAHSGHFSADEEKAIAVVSRKLAGGSQKPLAAFYKVVRHGKEFWIFVLATGGSPKWGQEGFVKPACYTVVVSPQFTVSRVISGWQ